MVPSNIDPFNLNSIQKKLLDLPRHKKRVLLAIIDFLTLSAVLAAIVSLRLGQFNWTQEDR